MSGCEYKKECNLRDLLRENQKGMCERTEPLMPTGPGPDSFVFSEYCPAWRCYKSKKKGELVTSTPVVDKRDHGWLD